MLVEENAKGDIGDDAPANDAALDRIKFDDEIFADIDALARSLSPIIKLLKLTGSYFESYNANGDHRTKQQHTERNDCKHSSWNFAEIYSAALTILLWFDIVRLLTAFIAADNKFNEMLVNKLVMVIILAQNASMKTAFYFAARSGRLVQALHQLRITNDFIKVPRELVGVRVAVYSISLAIYMAFFVYALFLTDGSFNFVVTPFVALVPINDGWLIVAKSLFALVNVLSLQSFLWPMTLYQTLARVLTRQFRMLNSRFKIANSQRRQFKGSLKIMRNRHQALCFAVRSVDSCLTAAPAAIFCGEMFTIIVLLYGFMFLNYTNPFVIVVYSSALAFSVVSLSTNVVNGTMLNSEVGVKSFFTGKA